jgi:hypothetical protein
MRAVACRPVTEASSEARGNGSELKSITNAAAWQSDDASEDGPTRQGPGRPCYAAAAGRLGGEGQRRRGRQRRRERAHAPPPG